MRYLAFIVRRVRQRAIVLMCITTVISTLAGAQEQIDRLEPARAGLITDGLSLRVRVTRCMPEQPVVLVNWRRGGEGLGGEVIRGSFRPSAANSGADAVLATPIALGQWSAPLPLETIVGRNERWEFPSITVEVPSPARQRIDPPAETVVEFEFLLDGNPLKRFVEPAPRGATVGFAFDGAAFRKLGPRDPGFLETLQGLSGHARARRERLEKALGEPAASPRELAVIGHLAGYGQAPGSGIGKAIGYKVRHCNPEIVADECRTLRLLGINALVGLESVELAKAAGFGAQFQRHYWGGPGSGSPMHAVTPRTENAEGCPFDSRLPAIMAEGVARAIDEHRAANAADSWGIWWDEIGVAAKLHLSDCPVCREQFVAYLKRQGQQPAQFGKTRWDDVALVPLFAMQPGRDGKPAITLAPAPTEAADALRYYYSYRFMTYATAQLFPESARSLEQAGIRLYAMQGPTPSWNGSSLDWHEFYDLGPNRAVVFETSNRDPRVWQWESYLGDIVRGIAARHRLPIGCLVKPHRGAPSQRMLSVVARGAEAVEWYTYGPDYAKGDSFSQSPELLEEVARVGRFLAKGEGRLYRAQWAARPQVAFVSPRSSEIWSRARGLGMTPFENAKWVFLALAHAHVPVDVLSEQQLAEGKLEAYKVIYVCGPNLRRDAAAQVEAWVRRGGLLWTDCLGLSRDEANQPNESLSDLFVADRLHETWGETPEYRATTLQAFKPEAAPSVGRITWDSAAQWGRGVEQAWIGRELLGDGGDVLGRFADGRPAARRHSVGRGEVVHVGFWTGLAYSARVRRDDYDMQSDFDAALRQLIAGPAIERKVNRPAIPAEPLVEAVALNRDGRRSVALMNWSYYRAQADTRRGEALRTLANVRIELPTLADQESVASLRHGPLNVHRGATPHVILPSFEAIDLLVLE